MKATLGLLLVFVGLATAYFVITGKLPISTSTPASEVQQYGGGASGDFGTTQVSNGTPARAVGGVPLGVK